MTATDKKVKPDVTTMGVYSPVADRLRQKAADANASLLDLTSELLNRALDEFDLAWTPPRLELRRKEAPRKKRK